MTWQDYAVWAIGACVVVWLLYRLWQRLCGARKGGCGACESQNCPLRSLRKE